MNVLYFDAFSGLSGNMIVASLLDAGLDFELWKSELSCLALSDYAVKIKPVKKQGIRALYFEVETEEQHAHRHLDDLLSIIDKSSLTENVKCRSRTVFQNLADAEASVHGCSVDEIHFHEVGAVDAIVDVVGSVIALEMLDISEIVCSPIRVGSGLVDMEHGRMPIPAPATAYLLRGIPTYSGDVSGEFTTPTGAALIMSLCSTFQPQPNMIVRQVGYGAGTRNYPHPNVLRAFIGERTQSTVAEEIWVLETDVDDMTSELMAYVQERLLELGALDATMIPTHMKKGRPGIRFSVLSSHENREKLTQLLLNETSTLGVRSSLVGRTKLIARVESIQTRYGPIAAKIVTRDGRSFVAPEFEDCKRVALRSNVPMQEIYGETMEQYYLTRSDKKEAL